jgi:ribonuclease D
MSPYSPGSHDHKSDPRHFHRNKSHQDSHGQSESQQLPPITAHPLASAEPPEVVTTNAGLAAMLEHVAAEGAFAFDSEFIGERTYLPQLCLVQVATPRRVFLVDPLAGVDLTPLWARLADPALEKIVLAGQQDLEPAVRATGRAPANVMDVQVAAGFVHVDYPLSLAKLVGHFVGAPLGKALTFTHWDKRPLSAVQLRYAADDVRYLPAARDAIAKLLAQTGRVAWAREECAAVLEDASPYCLAPELTYTRVRGRGRLGRRQLAVLRELASLRDQAARQEDAPTRTFLKDQILVALAHHPVRTVADLVAVRGLPRPVESRYGQQIVEATARGMALPESQLPPLEPHERPGSFAPPAIRLRIEQMCDDIARFCLERSVAPALVASQREVGRLCRDVALKRKDRPHRLLTGWRREFLKEVLDRWL